MTHPKDVAVPALPEPYRSLERCLSHPVMRQVLFAPGDYFTADQMNAHATAAVLADRASRVSVAEPVAPLWIKVTKAGMYWKTEDPDDESWMRIDIPLAAPLAPKAAEPAASPDVAKMVEEAKRLVEQWRDGSSRFSWHRPAADWLSRDLNAAIDALGAAATQARAAASEPLSVSEREVKP